MLKNKYLLAGFSILLVLTLVGLGVWWGQNQAQSNSAESPSVATSQQSQDTIPTEPVKINPISVYTTFYPAYFLAQELGGETVKVTNVVPVGSDPHDFEPSARTIEDINQAKVFIYNGQGLEPWAEKVAKSLDPSKVIAYALTSEVDLLKANEDDHGHEGEKEKHEESEFDPHVWLDPVRMQTIANKLSSVLQKVNPEFNEVYKRNEQKLVEEFQSLHEEYRQGLSSCKQKTAVVSHNAFSYLSSRYGFDTETISGLSTESEPSARQMATVTNTIKRKGLKYIFTETLVSPRVAETIANETGAQVLVLNPLEGLTQGEQDQNQTYITIMRQNLNNLRKGLTCEGV